MPQNTLDLNFFKLCNSLEEKTIIWEPVLNAFRQIWGTHTLTWNKCNLIKVLFLVEDRERVCGNSMCMSLHMYWSDSFYLWKTISVDVGRNYNLKTKSRSSFSTNWVRPIILANIGIDFKCEIMWNKLFWNLVFFSLVVFHHHEGNTKGIF